VRDDRWSLSAEDLLVLPSPGAIYTDPMLGPLMVDCVGVVAGEVYVWATPVATGGRPIRWRLAAFIASTEM
jgi:hypothetical protein